MIHEVEPLILASAAYPRMEELVLSARRRLQLALRIFDPDTRLRSDAARARNLSTWGDLLAERALAGVSVDVLVAHFDPLFAPGLHVGAERTRRRLREIASATGATLNVNVAHHPGEIGPIVRTLVWPLVRRRLAKRSEGKVRLWPPQRLWPATYHMKAIVADEAAMVIGGLDINERRFDTPRHDRPAEDTWHDVSVFVRGPAAGAASAFIAAQFADRDPRPGDEVPATVPLQDREVRFHATAAVRRRSGWAITPVQVRDGLLKNYLALIGSAKHLLYIENQFIRERVIVEAIAEQIRAEPALNVIIVTPAAPEEVAFQGESGDGMRHGEHLQVQLLRMLTEEFPDNVGLFMLAGARLPHTAQADHTRAVAEGRGIVYVHSKVAIADDRIAMISSANLNGRSLRMDSEAGISWRDDHHVRAFRHDLWRHHIFDSATCAPDAALEAWRHAAQHNAAEQPGIDGPHGFVLAWDATLAARYAQKRPYMPARYV